MDRCPHCIKEIPLFKGYRYSILNLFTCQRFFVFLCTLFQKESQECLFLFIPLLKIS